MIFTSRITHNIREFIFNSSRNIIIFSLLFFIIIGTALWLVYKNTEVMREQINKDFNQQQSILANQIATQIDANLRDIINEVLLLKRLRPMTTLPVFKELITVMVDRTYHKGVSVVGFIDTSGNRQNIVSTKNNLSSNLVFKETDSMTTSSGTITLGKLTHEMESDHSPVSITTTIAIAIPFGEEKKEKIFVKINLSYLVKIIASTIQSGKTGYVWVIDELGTLLFHPDASFIGKNAFSEADTHKPYIPFTQMNDSMKELLLMGKEGTGTYISGWHRGTEQEVKKLIAFKPINSRILGTERCWTVAVVAPVSEIEDTIKKIYRWNLSVEAVLIAGMFIFVLIIIIFQHHMSQTLAARVKQAEAEVHETEQVYSRVVAQATDLIYIIDLQMRVMLLNPIAERTFHQIFSFYHTLALNPSPEINHDKSYLKDRKLYELFGASQEFYIKDQIETTIKNKINHSFEHVVSLDERKIQFSSKLIPIRDEKKKIIYILGISRDDTEKFEVDQKIYNTEKLASIGTLAAGVAHELNNPLAIILGFTDLLLERFEEGTQEKKDLKIIDASASHAKKIVENLLGFARITEGLENYVDISQALGTVINIINNTLLNKKISLVLNVDNTLPKAKCDAREFQQIVFNLINNSIAAIDDNEGTLTISAHTKNNWVCITITDNGVGIPDSLKAKIFDPFFTTKKVGKGTGLGLSLCYGIVKKYGGKITFKSTSLTDVKNEASGTTFTVLLPIFLDDQS